MRTANKMDNILIRLFKKKEDRKKQPSLHGYLLGRFFTGTGVYAKQAIKRAVSYYAGYNKNTAKAKHYNTQCACHNMLKP